LQKKQNKNKIREGSESASSRTVARPHWVLGEGEQLLQLPVCRHLLRSWRLMNNLLSLPGANAAIRAVRKSFPHPVLRNGCSQSHLLVDFGSVNRGISSILQRFTAC
jgi:hypothetical protein